MGGYNYDKAHAKGHGGYTLMQTNSCKYFCAHHTLHASVYRGSDTDTGWYVKFALVRKQHMLSSVTACTHPALGLRHLADVTLNTYNAKNTDIATAGHEKNICGSVLSFHFDF